MGTLSRWNRLSIDNSPINHDRDSGWWKFTCNNMLRHKWWAGNFVWHSSASIRLRLPLLWQRNVFLLRGFGTVFRWVHCPSLGLNGNRKLGFITFISCSSFSNVLFACLLWLNHEKITRIFDCNLLINATLRPFSCKATPQGSRMSNYPEIIFQRLDGIGCDFAQKLVWPDTSPSSNGKTTNSVCGVWNPFSEAGGGRLND